MAKRKESQKEMPTGKMSVQKLLNFIVWLTGVIVSLSVGFAMIDGLLGLPSWLGGSTLAMLAGYVVVITTLISVVLGIVNASSQ
jgi:hypothetical protein